MAYTPESGDIVWLSFDPQAGHRPVVAPNLKAGSAKTGLMLCCPMTTKIKNYPFEVAIADAQPSVARADQVKSLDWRARKAKKKGAGVARLAKAI